MPSIDWHDRWSAGRIAFHSEAVHPDLIRFEDRFLSGGPRRVLVPLCGKTVDLSWLADRGHEVVGVELVPEAVAAFFAEGGLTPEVTSVAEGVTSSRAGGITMLCGDIFKVTKSLVGPIDRIWDRAALVALPAAVRIRYAAHLRSLAEPEAVLLQNSFEYDEAVMSGPPFSIAVQEIASLYGDTEVELLDGGDRIGDAAAFRERGHKYWIVRTHLIRLGAAGTSDEAIGT